MRGVLLIVGCQRSGTTILVDTLQGDDRLEVHGEGSAVLMQDYRLISVEQLEQVRRSSQAALLVAKPLCDSHRVQEALTQIPRSQALWLFRDWRDTSNSMIRKWPGHFPEIVEKFRQQDHGWLHWRSEAVDGELEATFLSLANDIEQEADAAAVFWWLRNQWFLRLDGPDHPDRIRPLCYEELVRSPEHWLRAVYEFAGIPAPNPMKHKLHVGRIVRTPHNPTPTRIAEACQSLYETLREHASRAWHRP
jgi:hypothetical protein